MIVQEGQEHIDPNGDVVSTAAEGKLRYIERRRPGRRSYYTNPWLIALMRRPRATHEQAAERADAEIGDLATGEGIMLGGAIGAILWGAAVLILWLIIR